MKKNSRQQNFEKSLSQIAVELDISNIRYEEAVERYENLGAWLCREESTVREYSPTIYPQGSFLLGTVIKPITDEEDYDIDLVCVVDLSRKKITQKKLKELIGIEIEKFTKRYGIKKAPKEGNRCWSIKYSDGAQFHMDILPSIPNLTPTNSSHPETEISITDKNAPNYYQIDENWPQSNPKGFAKWFKTSMEKQLRTKIAEFAAENRMSIDEVPEYAIKTTLQRSVQLLKRHRDIMFKDQEEKPISIIISTLAAKAYGGEDGISSALNNIVAKMENLFEIRNGKKVLRNPINKNEYFTDRWTQKDEEDFFAWVKQAKKFFSVDSLEFIEEASPERDLGEAFGEKLAQKIATRKLPTHNKPSSIPIRNIAIDSPPRTWRKIC